MGHVVARCASGYCIPVWDCVNVGLLTVWVCVRTDVANVEVLVFTMLLLHLPGGKIKLSVWLFKNLTTLVCREMFVGKVIFKHTLTYFVELKFYLLHNTIVEKQVFIQYLNNRRVYYCLPKWPTVYMSLSPTSAVVAFQNDPYDLYKILSYDSFLSHLWLRLEFTLFDIIKRKTLNHTTTKTSRMAYKRTDISDVKWQRCRRPDH